MRSATPFFGSLGPCATAAGIVAFTPFLFLRCDNIGSTQLGHQALRSLARRGEDKVELWARAVCVRILFLINADLLCVCTVRAGTTPARLPTVSVF